MSAAQIIAIDGPAASGKTTLGIRLADRLGYLFFDTGVMYRAITFAALDRGIPVEDAQAVIRLAREVVIDVRPPTVADGRQSDVLLDGQDVTWEIRQPQVDQNVSVVAAYPGVRSALFEQQRRVGLRGRVVMVGRDIGTVVLPEADLKIYLDASVEERARRRFAELGQRDASTNYESILEDMRQRDQIDSTRKVAPLRAAKEAILLRSDDLEAGEVLERVISLARQCEVQR